MSRAASGTLGHVQHQVVRFDVDAKNLYVKRVIWGSDSTLSSAILGVHPQDENDRDIRFEKVWSVVTKGQRVKITANVSQSNQRVVFHGWITDANIQAGGRMEDLEYTAMGLDWGLQIEKLFGSWCVARGADTPKAVWLRATQLVFNPDGKGNKATIDFAADGGSDLRPCFDLDDDPKNQFATYWTPADMVRYCVVGERKGDLSSIEGRIFPMTYRPGSELAGDPKVFDVNAEDEDIWAALVKIGARLSRGVTIRYQKDRSKSEIVFFTKKVDTASGAKQLEMPAATLTNVSLNDPMKSVSALDVQNDLAGIVRQIDCVTPTKLYDDLWVLKEGWKVDDEKAAFGDSGDAATRIAKFLRETDPQTSSDWERFKFVGRRFILNETGRDDCTDENADTGAKASPYNFTNQFETGDWAVRLRPFRHTRVKLKDGDESGTPLPIAVHVKFGATLAPDIQLGAHVQLLPDRAGIYFRDKPMVNVARALESGNHEDCLPTLVSIEAVIEGDQDSPHDVNAVSAGDDMPVPTFGLVRLDDGLRTTNQDDAGDAAIIQTVAEELATKALDSLNDARLVGSAVIPWISFAFDVGDVIDNINGRNLKIRALISKVTFDVEQQNTELAFEYPQIDTQTHTRNMPKFFGAGVGTTRDRGTQGLSMISDLLNLQALGHPVDAALRAAAGGASRSEVERLLQHALQFGNEADDPGDSFGDGS